MIKLYLKVNVLLRRSRIDTKMWFNLLGSNVSVLGNWSLKATLLIKSQLPTTDWGNQRYRILGRIQRRRRRRRRRREQRNAIQLGCSKPSMRLFPDYSWFSFSVRRSSRYDLLVFHGNNSDSDSTCRPVTREMFRRCHVMRRLCLRLADVERNRFDLEQLLQPALISPLSCLGSIGPISSSFLRN